MNTSMFASDRATHRKIAMTAFLAALVVIVVGVSAKPVDAVHGGAMRDVSGLVAPSGQELH